jgi:uncharacterized membrane protein
VYSDGGDGVYTTLDVQGAGGPNGGTVPLGMNDHGDIVGDFTNPPDGFPRHGFLLSDGVYTTFDVPPDSFLTVATGINNAGVIVGTYLDFDIDYEILAFHGYVLIDGVFTKVEVNGPFSDTNVLAINEQGQIAGWYLDENYYMRGFVGTPVHN